MHRAIAGLVALVAFVQVIEGVTFETTHFVDVVAQKLEDHLQGKNLEDKITIDDCKAAYDEFEQWDLESYNNNVVEGPLAVARDYLSDFLHHHLEENREHKLTSGFVEQLESTYEKARSSYTHKRALQCEDEAGMGSKTCALVASLTTGKGGPVTPAMIDESLEEIEDIYSRMMAIAEGGHIYKDTDTFLALFKVYNTPEVHVVQFPIDELLTEESREKLEQQDPEEIQLYMDTYKNEMVKFASRATE